MAIESDMSLLLQQRRRKDEYEASFLVVRSTLLIALVGLGVAGALHSIDIGHVNLKSLALGLGTTVLFGMLCGVALAVPRLIQLRGPARFLDTLRLEIRLSSHGSAVAELSFPIDAKVNPGSAEILLEWWSESLTRANNLWLKGTKPQRVGNSLTWAWELPSDSGSLLATATTVSGRVLIQLDGTGAEHKWYLRWEQPPNPD